MLNWKNDKSFEIDGYLITLDYEYGGSRKVSTSREFIIMKTREFLEHYIDIFVKHPKRVLELGVYQGGSFVFFDRLFKPDKISAIELSNARIPALDDYVRQFPSRARLHYGTSQDDHGKLAEIIDEDFGGELDLVVDDASHFYQPTKTSFSVAFPKLRPGGLYIIEDWCWSFQAPYQDHQNSWIDQDALANLMIDLIEDMTLGTLIQDIQISRPMLKIRRSDAPSGRVFEHQGRRGRVFNPL